MRQIDVEDANLGAAAAITNLAGIYIADQTVGTTLNYGLHSTVTSGTGKANIFSSGTAVNVFRGDTRIGSTVAPTVPLDLTGAALLSSTVGIGNLLTMSQTAGQAEAATILLEEKDTTPANPTQDTKLKVYMKADKFVIQFNNGGTVRYFTLDLTQSGATPAWAQSTSAP